MGACWQVLESAEREIESSLAATTQAGQRAGRMYSKSCATACFTWLVVLAMSSMFMGMVLLIRITGAYTARRDAGPSRNAVTVSIATTNESLVIYRESALLYSFPVGQASKTMSTQMVAAGLLVLLQKATTTTCGSTFPPGCGWAGGLVLKQRSKKERKVQALAAKPPMSEPQCVARSCKICSQAVDNAGGHAN
eukprot:SM000211S06623  [mRNA]  locus=s211:85900:87422:+ [translate_table: standard]